MSALQDQIVRKTVSLPASLWDAVGNHRFLRRFPTETAAVMDVVSRGLAAGAVLGAIADIATGRRTGHGKFSIAATKTFGDAPRVSDLVERDIHDYGAKMGMTLTPIQIQEKARQVCETASRMAGGTAASGQAAILDIAIDGLIEWALRSA